MTTPETPQPASIAEIEAGILEVATRHLGFTGKFDPRLRLVEDLGFDSLMRRTLSSSPRIDCRMSSTRPLARAKSRGGCHS